MQSLLYAIHAELSWWFEMNLAEYRSHRRFILPAMDYDSLTTPVAWRIYWIEFKRPGGKLDERQIARIEELRELGHTVYVVDNIQQAMQFHNEEMCNAKKLHAYLSCRLKYG